MARRQPSLMGLPPKIRQRIFTYVTNLPVVVYPFEILRFHLAEYNIGRRMILTLLAVNKQIRQEMSLVVEERWKTFNPTLRRLGRTFGAMTKTEYRILNLARGEAMMTQYLGSTRGGKVLGT